MEVVFQQDHIAIGLLDAEVQELIEKANELYAVAEAHGEANIMAQEDLNRQVITIAHQEQTVVERTRSCRKRRKRSSACLNAGTMSSHPVRLTLTPVKHP
jgi:FtsZ-binding cell division protein ZapB